MSEVVLTPETVAIAAVGVFPEKEVAALVRKTAVNFSTHTAKDYAARVIWLSSVECRGKYREFMGYDGLFASWQFLAWRPPASIGTTKTSVIGSR